MIEYRRYLNCDSPGLVAVWNCQPPTPHRLRPLNSQLLEQFVCAKPYFDPEGLIVAVQDQRIIGFVHAGFRPGDRIGQRASDEGIICQLLVDPRVESLPVARELLQRAEDYLQARGAQEFCGGAVGCHGPFYLGLYGGSHLPGVLADDGLFSTVLRERGYTAGSEQRVLQLRLCNLRTPMERPFLQLRRQFRLNLTSEPNPSRWSEVCEWCWMDRDHFIVLPNAGSGPLGTLSFWNMEPLSGSLGLRAVGLLDIPNESSWNQPESIPCFLAEALRHFQSQGVSLAEVQCSSADSALAEGCLRLGFIEVARGVQFRR